MKFRSIFCVFIASSQLLLCAHQPLTPVKSVYTDLGKAFCGRIEEASPNTQAKELFRSHSTTVPSLNDKSTIATAIAHYKNLYALFAINDSIRLPAPSSTANTLQPDTWKDLRLVYGDKHAPLATLVSAVTHPDTKMGAVVTEKLLISPIDSIATLQCRQNFIKKLVNDDSLYNALKKSLETIAANEDTILHMWTLTPDNEWDNVLSSNINLYWEDSKKPSGWRRAIDHHPWLTTGGLVLTSYLLMTGLYRELSGGAQFYDYMLSSSLTGPCKKFIANIFGSQVQPKNFATCSADLSKALREANHGDGSTPSDQELMHVAQALAETREAVRTVQPQQQNAINAGGIFSPEFRTDVKRAFAQFSPSTLKQKGTLETCLSAPTNAMRALYQLAIPAFAIYLPIQTFAFIKRTFFDKYQAVKRAYREVNSIATITQTTAVLTPMLTTTAGNALTLLPKLIDLSNGTLDKEFRTLATALQSPIYNPGTLLSVYKRIFDFKDKFSGILEAIGEIDAYVAMATAIREHRTAKNGYCFPTLETRTTPHLALTGAWNPLTPTNEAIGNSIELGGSLQSRNTIITGPNAGGKSTFLRTVLTATLLGQTFGVVPAQTASFTPFSYLDSYMNIEDNPAEKKSLFKMQGIRMTSLLNTVKALHQDQHALVIVDELFSGTNPDDAAELGLATAVHRLAHLTNSIWLISTHHRKITNAEQDTHGVFTNFHVNVNRDSHGKFLGYPFTITPGVSRDSTACDVLASEGFDAEILNHVKRG